MPGKSDQRSIWSGKFDLRPFQSGQCDHSSICVWTSTWVVDIWKLQNLLINDV